MNWLPPKKFILGCSGLVLLTFLACSGAFVWWLNNTEYVGYASPDFCTARDELYQTINTKAQDWLKELPISSVPIIHFSTPSGKAYVVSEDMLSNDNSYFLFISTQQSHPYSPYGKWGYMYAVSGKLPDFYPSSIKISYVGEKIYCYEWLQD
jgi:hypothetical protein